MQLIRTYMTFDEVLEYILPSSIFKIYRAIKKAYSASALFANVFIINLFMVFFKENNQSTEIYRKIWSKEKSAKESKSVKEVSIVRPYKISVPDSLLNDLKSRLERTRIDTTSRKPKFNKVLNPVCIGKLINYWKTQFDWRKHEKELNKCPNFKTRIENIDIHFLHFKADQHTYSKAKLVPLLLIHNWPGSFADFHNVIPILQSSCKKNGFDIEIVCPSLPGCGFSEAPFLEDFSAINLSEILLALMDRLGYTEFYVHGYGWGAITASLMARYYPYRVKGMHVNMCFALPNLFDSFIRTLVVSLCPFFINRAEYNIIFPLKEKIRLLLEETAFLHMQCTKPDTVECAVTESPIALAIHILEKFLFKKNPDNLQQQDENITEKTLDGLLRLITLLWVSNDFSNGAKFFKESMSGLLKRTHDNGVPLTVPCGVAFFPDEIFMLPKYMLENMVENLVSYTVMPRGGHFAAIEEPHLLAKDILKFVRLVETDFNGC